MIISQFHYEVFFEPNLVLINILGSEKSHFRNRVVKERNEKFLHISELMTLQFTFIQEFTEE